jgi:hypothetical protein
MFIKDTLCVSTVLGTISTAAKKKKSTLSSCSQGAYSIDGGDNQRVGKKWNVKRKITCPRETFSSHWGSFFICVFVYALKFISYDFF